MNVPYLVYAARFVPTPRAALSAHVWLATIWNLIGGRARQMVRTMKRNSGFANWCTYTTLALVVDSLPWCCRGVYSVNSAFQVIQGSCCSPIDTTFVESCWMPLSTLQYTQQQRIRKPPSLPSTSMWGLVPYSGPMWPGRRYTEQNWMVHLLSSQLPKQLWPKVSRLQMVLLLTGSMKNSTGLMQELESSKWLILMGQIVWCWFESIWMNQGPLCWCRL